MQYLTFGNVINTLIIFALMAGIMGLVYLAMIFRELWLSAKTTRFMIEKVNTQLDPVLKDSSEVIGSISTIAGVIATRMKQVLGILDFVSLFTGGENRSDVLKKVIPSKKVFQSFLSGIKKGIEVLTTSKAKEKPTEGKTGRTRTSKEKKND
jgi:hypothetical protein